MNRDLRRRLADYLAFQQELGIERLRVGPAVLAAVISPPPSASDPAPVTPEAAPPEAAAELVRIRADLGDCTRCKLHRLGRRQIVFGSGNPQADLVFVGEGPGADEDIQGLPFVGRAGQLLTDMIQKGMGLDRASVYICNVVKCRPPQNRTPEADECATCAPFLRRQIAAIRPKLVVALGACAAQTLLAYKGSLSSVRGRPHPLQVDQWSTQLLVTYHPAYLLRDPSQKREAWKDLQLAMELLGLPRS
ncbi:MAG: uracil-DNA glycosylase [Terriglobales bacterium]